MKPKPKDYWKRYSVERTCKCGKLYSAYTYNLKRGWGMFCSRQCALTGRKGRPTNPSEETRKKISNTLKKKYANGELVSPLRRLGLIGKRGKDAMNWRGGKTLIGQKLRTTADYRDWHKTCLERDNYTCSFCKVRGGKLEVDHIKAFALHPELRLAVSNGRTLCKDCHRRVTLGWKPEKDFRPAFMDALLRLAESDERIVFVTCDVGFSFLEEWQRRYPNRYFNFGVTENSAMMICAGLALSGLRPVFYSMINFAVYRPFEAIRNGLGYHNAPVLVAGVQGSVKYKMLGFSHTSRKNEDIDLLYHVPNMRVMIPMKDEEVFSMLEKHFTQESPCYIRL